MPQAHSRLPQKFQPPFQELRLSISRRQFFTAAGVVVVAGGAGGTLLARRLGASDDALAAATAMPGAGSAPAADTVDLAALAKPGPAGDISLGSDKAPVTIIEYASMTCPHCAHFSATTFPELKKKYIDTGKVRFIFREFPFDKVAAAGFMLARCASMDGGSARYMAVVETLFAKQDQWVTEHPLEPLENIAKQLGFSDQMFKACLTNQQVLNDIEAVRNRAVEKLGVNSTPTFFVNGTKIVGDVPLETLAKAIDPYLKAG
jgi:protein-disulfide isomerase